MVLQSLLVYFKRYCKLFSNRYFPKINRPNNLEECLNQNTMPNKFRHLYVILGIVPVVYYFYCCYHPSVRIVTPRQQFDEYLPRYFDLNAVNSSSHVESSTTENTDQFAGFIGTKPPKVIFNNTPYITSSHTIIKLNITRRRKGQLNSTDLHSTSKLDYDTLRNDSSIMCLFENYSYLMYRRQHFKRYTKTAVTLLLQYNKDPFTSTTHGTTVPPIPLVKPVQEKTKSMFKKFCLHNKTGLGPITVDRLQVSIGDVDKLYPNVLDGGHYVPPDCFPSNKLAIFVPIKNRTDNLAIFLYNIHPFLLNQNIEYRIFVIEQYGWEHFNKGRLYNAAFMESQKYGRWKCYMFHDVDLLPMDSRILYSCPTWPRHMSATIQDNYNKIDPKYHVLFGGVTVMSGEHFKKVNGYSNAYWGWGGEDHDMFWRLRGKQMNIVRYNRSIAVYSASPHKRGAVNPYRYYLLTSSILRADKEGLNTVDYKLLNTTLHHLYTHILIDANPYKENIKNTTLNIIKHYLDMGVGIKIPKRLL